jgi:hypothetical protein
MKILTLILFFLFLNGCLQNTAFLGPAVTVASTGNIAQAGLSYSSNLAIKKITGKTPIENVKLILQPKDNENKIITSAKNKIKEVSRIEDLSNR